MYIRLVLKSQRYTCFWLPNAEIKCMCHYTQLIVHLFVYEMATYILVACRPCIFAAATTTKQTKPQNALLHTIKISELKFSSIILQRWHSRKWQCHWNKNKTLTIAIDLPNHNQVTEYSEINFTVAKKMAQQLTTLTAALPGDLSSGSSTWMMAHNQF
jgi:predicted metal-binding protein